ncbi:hypothetical protein KKD19_06115 [Patescibacteria group bacterium]|nr:hypothetical protein [Patescibacteria group bacterium]MBU4512779.1 hypothetical protein [Patescibacteria group bacterium]MCG2692532.1 hypothetical protein [Candidatus Parcubacteria bacterium]
MRKVQINFLESFELCEKVKQKEQNNKRFPLKGLVLAFIFFAAGLFSFVAVLGNTSVAAAPAVPAVPTVLSVVEASRHTANKPLIAGVTVNDTTVDVYIDGIFNGRAEVGNHESGTANFSYYPFLNLKPGQHTLYTVARTKTEPIERSVQSETIIFEISGFIPPTLFTPVFNLETTEFRPFIVGLSHNDSGVRVYIDDEFDGQFYVKNHISGTANFAYKPQGGLAIGIHTVYAVTFNKDTGQESLSSGRVIFDVKAPYPAPVLFQPTAASVSGVVKSGSRVEIYVNGIKKTNLESVEHPSGTANFTYNLASDLRPGTNIISAVAYSAGGKMSRLSQPVYYQVGEVAAGVTQAEEAPIEEKPTAITKEEPEPTSESPEELDVVLFPGVDEGEQTDVQVGEGEAGGQVEVTETKPAEGEVTITKEGEEGAPLAVSGEQEPDQGEEGLGEEAGTNWSKIIGLVILAVLIIILIIQLLRKEEDEGEKKGETLKLFEEGGKKEKEASVKTEEKPQEGSEEEPTFPRDEDIPPPPPPPPSSNLPF